MDRILRGSFHTRQGNPFAHPEKEERKAVNASLQALVVEDHVAMRSVVRKMLQQMRYFQLIDDASDGEEAWAKLANGNFDLAVSDVNESVAKL